MLTSKTKPYLLCVAILAAVAGCDPHEDDGARTTSTSIRAAAIGPDQELIPFVSDAVLAEKAEAFRARNGQDWEAAHPEGWNALIPGVMNMVRRGAAPSGNQVPTAEQQARALGFVRANLDLLGIDPAIELRTRGVAGFVEITSDRRPFPGLEADWRVTNAVSISLAFAQDGSIRHVYQLRRFPRPTLSTTPVHPATDPVIVDRLVGQPLYYGGSVFSTIARADLEQARIVTHVEEREAGVLLTLAYRIGIQRDDVDQVCPPLPWVNWEIVVDTRTGDILDGATDVECLGW